MKAKLLHKLDIVWALYLVVCVLLVLIQDKPLAMNYDLVYLMFLVFPLAMCRWFDQLYKGVKPELRLRFFIPNLKIACCLFCLDAILNIAHLNFKSASMYTAQLLIESSVSIWLSYNILEYCVQFKSVLLKVSRNENV